MGSRLSGLANQASGGPTTTTSAIGEGGGSGGNSTATYVPNRSHSTNISQSNTTNDHTNSNNSDTTTRRNNHQSIHSAGSSSNYNDTNNLSSSHPTATILMRAYNPSTGFVSLLGHDLSERVVSSPNSEIFPSNVFRSRPYSTQFLSRHNGFKCPVCSKILLTEDIEFHLVVCLTNPNRISYNEDILICDKGECVICFEELEKGNRIARLPCLCIYHKDCIDQWFEVNRSCPEHPSNSSTSYD